MARRCECGKPQVIETGSFLDDGTPFPTLWWLTCKRLAAEVGRLESTGLIAEVNRLLCEDPQFKGRLEASTKRLCAARDGGLSSEPARHPGGGPDRVKCLHAHLAHHLVSGDNPVGDLVLQRLTQTGKAAGRPELPCV